MNPASASVRFGLSQREGVFLGVLALSALLLRLVFLEFESAITPDGYYYATLGKELVSGNLAEGLSPYWPPLFPLLVGISSLVFQDLELGGRMVSVITGSLIVVPEYLLVRNVWGARPASISAIFMVFQPDLLTFSPLLSAHVPFAFLYLVAVLITISAVFDGDKWRFLWSGVSFACCYLIRPEGFGYVLVVAVLTVFFGLYRRSARFGELTTRLVLLAVGFGVLALPYIGYIRLETGHWTISSKFHAHLNYSWADWRQLADGDGLTHLDTLYANAPASEGDSPEAANSSIEGEFSWMRFLKAFSIVFFRQYNVVVPQVFPPLVLLLVGLGLFRWTEVPGSGPRQLALACFILATLVGYAATVPGAKYLMAQAPIVYGWAANGLVELAQRLRSMQRGRRWRFRLTEPMILSLLILIVGLSMTRELTYPFRAREKRQALEMRKVGSWIREHSDGKPVILANSPVVAFYAGTTRHYFTPSVPVQNIISHAQRIGAEYLVVDERKILQLELFEQSPLLDPRRAPPELEPVFRYDEVPHAKVVVYRVASSRAAISSTPMPNEADPP